MKKIKQIRKVIILECQHCRKLRKVEGIARYLTQKNKKNTPTRLMLQKYCFFSRKHQSFIELK